MIKQSGNLDHLKSDFCYIKERDSIIEQCFIIDFGFWSKVFLDYVSLRKALRVVIRMHAGQVGA